VPRCDARSRRGLGQLDRVHLRVRRGAGDAQRAVAAVRAQFERECGVRAPDRCVEDFALLVADVDQERLFIGELVDGGDDVVDVTVSRIGDDVVGRSGLAAVADLAGPLDAAGADRDRHAQDRPAQKRHSLLQAHTRGSLGVRRSQVVATLPAGLPDQAGASR
jgi:hypothetical protein